MTALEDEHTVDACPGCDSSQIQKRVTTDDYKCYDCGETFDEPNTRPPRTKGGKASLGRIARADDSGGGQA